MLAIGVEATIIPLGFGVSMLVCALLCFRQFWSSSNSFCLQRQKYSCASCDCNWSLNMEKMAIILWFQMMAILSKVVIAMFAMAQAWALMPLLSVCFLAFWSSFSFLQPCGWLESGFILGVMPTTLIPYTPSLSKFVESPKLTFLFITSHVFFFSFQNIPSMNEGECLMVWVFCLVQVKSFLQCIFNPCPWFTNNKQGHVVSYKLGSIVLDDASFCFQTPSRSWSTTNMMRFAKVILHPISKCCKFLPICNHQVLWYVEKQATQLPLLIYNQFFSFSCFQLWVCKVIGCCRCFNNAQWCHFAHNNLRKVL